MNVLAKDLWEDVREAFRSEKGSALTDLWLRQAGPLSFQRGVFTLGVPNEVVCEWLQERYQGDLENLFLRVTGSPVKIVVKVERSLPRIDRDKLEGEGKRLRRVSRGTSLVVRPENRLAHGALKRVLDDPSTGNPLFLYGSAGTGKSTLVRHHLERRAEESGGLGVTVSIKAEVFSSGLVRAIHESDLPAFRGRMLAADVFVLEEAHLLRGKARTQRDFLSIMQYHVSRGRPVILTSRHPPNGIFLLDEGLRSHFLSGNLIRINDYSESSKVEILEEISHNFRRPVPRETLDRIAHRIPGSFDRQVRFLEKAAAFSALSNEDATLEFLARKFPELAGEKSQELDLDRLMRLVAQEFGTTVEDISSNRKVRRIVLARHLVVYLATVVFNMRSRRVMRHLGGLSPSTTAYARRKIELKRRDDPVFDVRVRRLLEELNQGQKLLF